MGADLDSVAEVARRTVEATRSMGVALSAGSLPETGEPTFELPEDEIERHVKVKNIEYKPMDVEEAVLQMDLIGDNFLVFTNARSDQINVLYRRKDGHYGLIQPSS